MKRKFIYSVVGSVVAAIAGTICCAASVTSGDHISAARWVFYGVLFACFYFLTFGVVSLILYAIENRKKYSQDRAGILKRSALEAMLIAVIAMLVGLIAGDLSAYPWYVLALTGAIVYLTALGLQLFTKQLTGRKTGDSSADP